MKWVLRTAMCLVLVALMMPINTAMAASGTASCTANGNTVSTTDNGEASGGAIAVGDTVNCTLTLSSGRFFFWVGRGFSPLFSHTTTTTFVAHTPGAASIIAYWSVPKSGSVTATFLYTINP